MKKKSASNYSLYLIVGLVIVLLVGYLLSTQSPTTITDVGSSPEPLTINEIGVTIPTLPPSTTPIVLGTQTYKADFSKLWETRYVLGSQGSRVFGSTGTASGGYGNILVKGSTGDTPADLNFFLPYNLPTTYSYVIDFDVQLLPATDYKAWVRLATNYSTNGFYLISLYPATQTFVLDTINTLNPSSNGSYTTTSTSILKDGAVNHVRIARNPVNGILEVYLNGKSVVKISNKSFIGGTNRVYTTSYSLVQQQAQFSNFKVLKITSTLN